MIRSHLATMLFLAVVVTGCAVAAQPSATPSFGAPSVPTESATAPPSATSSEAPAPPSAEPSAQLVVPQPTAPIGDNRDAIAEVIVDGGVRVRSLPSVDDVSTKYEPLLRRGDEVFVIGGPVAGDGYDWYLVQSLVNNDRGPFGWVAFESRDGETWIEDQSDTDCAAVRKDPRRYGVILDEVLIHCFGNGELEFELEAGMFCFPDDPALIAHDWLGLECGMLSGDACGTCGLRVAAHPDSGFEIPRDHARWAIRGHFDDPAAAECAPGPDADPNRIEQAAVHACRSTLVLTSLERLGDAG